MRIREGEATETGWARLRMALRGGLALLVLAATTVRAEEAVLLIQAGGGISAEDAKLTLAEWHAEASSIEGLIALAPSFPRIVTKRDMPELEEGEHVVAIGLCRPGEMGGAPEVLQRFRGGGVLPKVVANPGWGWEGCPTLRDGWNPGQAESYTTPAVGFIEAMVLNRHGTGRDETMVHMVLTEFRRGVLDYKTRQLPAGCTATLRFDEATLLIDKTCGEAKETLGFAQSGDKLAPAPGLETMADVQVVIWGGGKTEAEAQAVLAEWEREREALGKAVALAPGYPKIASSEEFPGLNPGYRVVVSAVCPGSRLKEPMKILQAFRAGAYAKAVKPKSGLAACPTVPEQMNLLEVERARAGALELTVMKLGHPDRVPWRSLAVLRDGKGKGRLLDWKHANNNAATAIDGGNCFDAELVRRGSGLGFDLRCGAGRGGGAISSWPKWLTYRISKGRITVTEKQGRVAEPGAAGE
jgi:hypothetical protein